MTFSTLKRKTGMQRGSRPKRNFAHRLGTAKPKEGSRRDLKDKLDRATSLLVNMIIKGRHASRTFYEGRELPVAITFRLAELATARGLSLTRLKEISGLPPGAVQHIWYNRVTTVNLAALTRLTEILEVEPGDLFAKAA